MIEEIEVLWLTAGLGCDGDTIAITAATQPSIEDLVRGAIPAVPKVILRNPVLATETGDEFLEYFHRAAEGRLERPFILVVEGSIPNEKNKAEGYWAAMAAIAKRDSRSPPALDRPLGAARMGRGRDGHVRHLRRHPRDGRKSNRVHGSAGLSGVAVEIGRRSADRVHAGMSGAARQHDPDASLPAEPGRGNAPMIPLDECLRPKWLFEPTLHEGCDRGGYYEQADFAERYGEPQCIVKLGCWGPVIQCNVGKRGWMNGIGGCPNVGGICIGCTMPGFPDRFMPFMSQPPGSLLSAEAITNYGLAIRALRKFTQASFNKEPEWRRPAAND